MTDDDGLASSERFWAAEAAQLTWTTPPQTILPSDGGSGGWFSDGLLSAAYNLVTRHVLAGRGDAAAVLWDSPVTGAKRRVSYRELQTEMEVAAGVLRDLGVRRGDRVLIYMPMVPEALVAMLACTFIGAVHVVVFGGFASRECAKRIESAQPVVVVTASCGVEGKRVIPYLPFIREAIEMSTHKPGYTLLLQRPMLRAELDKRRRELSWDALMRSAGMRAGPTVRPPYPETARVPGSDGGAVVELGTSLAATAPHYILHTSGTTGTPKGVVRPLSHLVGLSHQIREHMQISVGETIFCASDIGWVVGHAFIVYAPLLAGATTVLYEGKPVGTPSADSFWRIVAEYSVKVLFCAPSALRGIARDDPTLRGMDAHDISSLRTLFLAGERSEPALVTRFEALLAPRGGARVVDNWWSTESGSPITGLLPGVPSRPGSAGLALPGWTVRIVDDTGARVPHGTQGNIVVAQPLAPTALSGVWREPARFEAYFARFPGCLDTGDVGVLDAAGYLTVVARSDDVINVAAHRLGTAVIEGAIAGVAGVTEAFVVPLRDALKGQVPVAFVVATGAAADVERRVRAAVRREVGAIASLRAVVRVPAGAVPRTRSGKVVRRAFRGVLEGVGSTAAAAVPEGVEPGVWAEVVRRAVEAGVVVAAGAAKTGGPKL